MRSTEKPTKPGDPGEVVSYTQFLNREDAAITETFFSMVPVGAVLIISPYIPIALQGGPPVYEIAS